MRIKMQKNLKVKVKQNVIRSFGVMRSLDETIRMKK